MKALPTSDCRIQIKRHFCRESFDNASHPAISKVSCKNICRVSDLGKSFTRKKARLRKVCRRFEKTTNTLTYWQSLGRVQRPYKNKGDAWNRLEGDSQINRSEREWAREREMERESEGEGEGELVSASFAIFELCSRLLLDGRLVRAKTQSDIEEDESLEYPRFKGEAGDTLVILNIAPQKSQHQILF